WNFLPFRPGLVGGHCIGVDPYYLMHKSESVGYHPDLIDTARAVNNKVGAHVAGRVLDLLKARGIAAAGARALVLGLTFKEDCPDLRNSRVVDVIQVLRDAGVSVDAHDSWADPDEAEREVGVRPLAQPQAGAYDAVILAVAHKQFRGMDVRAIRAFGKPHAVVYDVKSVWPRAAVDERL
ncbi:MAG: UDP binding domain-containing protein, partial [Luteimonas sp.]